MTIHPDDDSVATESQTRFRHQNYRSLSGHENRPEPTADQEHAAYTVRHRQQYDELPEHPKNRQQRGEEEKLLVRQHRGGEQENSKFRQHRGEEENLLVRQQRKEEQENLKIRQQRGEAAFRQHREEIRQQRERDALSAKHRQQRGQDINLQQKATQQQQETSGTPAYFSNIHEDHKQGKKF